METIKLNFSVDGAFITRLAREKCHEDGRLAYAIDLLTSCMQTDQLTTQEIEQRAYDILNGRAELKGIYPGPDYRFEYIPGKEKSNDISDAFVAMQKKLTEKEEHIQALQRRYLYLYDSISEWERNRILKAYINDGYLEDDPHFLEPIDADGMQGEDEYNAALYDLQDEVELRNAVGGRVIMSTDPMSPVFRVSQTMQNPTKALNEYMSRMTSDDDTSNDYGWLEPNGTYHPVEWGEHAKWAAAYLDEHYPYENEKFANLYFRTGPDGKRQYINNGDVLVYSLGWVLIDNPSQGLGRHTCRPHYPMTKAQKEFLYDYYTKRKMTHEANALYENDND